MKTSPRRIFSLIFPTLVMIFNTLQGQSLINLQPSSGQKGQQLTLTLSGQNTNFQQATGTSFWLQQATSTMIYPQNINISSNTMMSGDFMLSNDLPAGSYDVAAVNSIDGQLFMFDAFELMPNPVPPYLTGIAPNQATQGQTLSLLISGQNTNFQAGTGTFVWFSQGSETIGPNSYNTLSNNTLEANFTFGFWHQPGYYDVNTVNQLDGTLTLPSGFLLLEGLAPAITSVVPDNSVNGTWADLDVFFENTQLLNCGYINAEIERFGILHSFENSEVITNTQLHINSLLPYTLQMGYYNLNIYTDLYGQITLPNGFLILNNPYPPQIVSIQPDFAYKEEYFIVQIETVNTWFLNTNLTYAWLTNPDNSFMTSYGDVVPANDTSLTVGFSIPDWFWPGLYDLQIYDEIDGVIILPQSFEIRDTLIGIHTLGKNSGFMISPNPVNEVMKLTSEEDLPGCSISVFNVMGKMMLNESIEIKAGVNVEIYFSDLAPGMYFIKIENKNIIYTKKIIKN